MNFIWQNHLFSFFGGNLYEADFEKDGMASSLAKKI